MNWSEKRPFSHVGTFARHSIFLERVDADWSWSIWKDGQTLMKGVSLSEERAKLESTLGVIELALDGLYQAVESVKAEAKAKEKEKHDLPDLVANAGSHREALGFVRDAGWDITVDYIDVASSVMIQKDGRAYLGIGRLEREALQAAVSKAMRGRDV